MLVCHSAVPPADRGQDIANSETVLEGDADPLELHLRCRRGRRAEPEDRLDPPDALSRTAATRGGSRFRLHHQHPHHHPDLTEPGERHRRFRELTDKALRRGVFHSVPDLIAKIEEYLAAHNDDPKPFIWTATADDILAKVARGRVALQAVNQ